MQTHAVLDAHELASQAAELLPERETLLLNINVAPVVGVNVAIAINAATINSTAGAAALQSIGLNFG